MSEEKKEIVDKSTSESSSSIGVESESDKDDGVEIQSGGSKLDSMASLEEFLPVKKGLSKYYNGKSESFRDLLSIGVDGDDSIKQIAKNEHVVTKKRRLTISHKWRVNKRTSSSSSSQGHVNDNKNNNNIVVQQSSMPNLVSAKKEEDGHKEEHEKVQF